jgi:hypothetical protein
VTTEHDDTARKPGGRFLLLGVLALVMGIGGIRFTYAARGLFDQNTQTYMARSGAVSYCARPWPEPWILTFCATASILMLAGGIGLLVRRRWGLTFAGFAGLAWIISATGYVLSSYWFMEVAQLWSNPKFSYLRHYLVAESAIGAVAIIVGLLFVTLEWRPRWADVDGEPRNKHVAIPAFVAWGLISFAASTVFARWLLGRV